MAIHLEHVQLKVRTKNESAQRCRDCDADYFIDHIRCPDCESPNLIADPISTIIIKSGEEEVFLYVRKSEMKGIKYGIDRLVE
jgi:hypothetical protein